MRTSEPSVAVNANFGNGVITSFVTRREFDGNHCDRAVWRAVIVQALQDAATRSNDPEIAFHRMDAQRWLTGKSKNFYMVCDLADLHPEQVRAKALKALENGCKWRESAGQGPRYTELKAYREARKRRKSAELYG